MVPFVTSIAKNLLTYNPDRLVIVFPLQGTLFSTGGTFLIIRIPVGVNGAAVLGL